MKSRWEEKDARAALVRWGEAGRDLALRTYSARLLGADPSLVLHGGGNTSVKATARDLFGEEIDVLCVKGSGWDLAEIEPAGHPAVRLSPLLRLRALDRLSDEEMVDFQRANLLSQASPTPSVETLLHAFLPAKFIDHTHAEAILALADQPDARAVVAQAFGARVGFVPYVMPGFALARRAAEVFAADPTIEGLVLERHGVFSFGASAKESYERMIALVSIAEAVIAAQSRGQAKKASPRPRAGPGAAAALPILRGLLAEA
ncbi:MAG: class II aldolase/adducin family protein, partial [Caulobacteraceae bacterium]